MKYLIENKELYESLSKSLGKTVFGKQLIDHITNLETENSTQKQEISDLKQQNELTNQAMAELTIAMASNM